tara:strand:- start:5143 stop:5259 length:117 start_codon:yes stop_codon:yes gene_type:complete
MLSTLQIIGWIVLVLFIFKLLINFKNRSPYPNEKIENE